jgi:hypothetical protein
MNNFYSIERGISAKLLHFKQLNAEKIKGNLSQRTGMPFFKKIKIPQQTGEHRLNGISHMCAFLRSAN